MYQGGYVQGLKDQDYVRDVGRPGNKSAQDFRFVGVSTVETEYTEVKINKVHVFQLKYENCSLKICSTRYAFVKLTANKYW